MVKKYKTSTTTRRQLLDLQHDLTNKLDEAVHKKDTNILSSHLDRLTGLHSDVKSTNELLMETEQINTISETSVKLSRALINDSININAENFINAVNALLKSSKSTHLKFNYKKFMVANFKQGIPFNFAVPLISILCNETSKDDNLLNNNSRRNSLYNEEMKKTKKIESFNEKDDFINPKEMNAQTEDVKETTMNDERIKKLHTKLRKEKISNYIKFIKGKDFNQTVENLFDLSFLIKNGDALVNYKNDEPVVVISSIDKEKRAKFENKQTVVSLNAKDFESINKYCEELGKGN
eukprot:GAHX01000473.1.p1 GENE.GAHX01000473.1~~GAHX01000473.1.p1  ORF type:complete len:309 (+),score=84.21 GAHX01000473.1:48-929(+)